MGKKTNGEFAVSNNGTGGLLGGLLVPAICAVSILLTGLMLQLLLFGCGETNKGQTGTTQYAIMDRYDMQMTNTLSDVLDGVLAIKKTYWLDDSDQVAPKPNQENYGVTNDPSTLGWLSEEAAELLDGQQLYFNTEIRLAPDASVNYYLDDTVLVVTWKEVINNITYTFSEVKIAHPSQFRRFLAGGEYGSSIQLTTTEMAASVNAIVASSGDFYKFRTSGIIVYDGVVQKMNGIFYDTCFIDENGDLRFVYAGEIKEQAAAQQYVDDNNVRFSLGFGPIMIDNGEIVDIDVNYALGEVSEKFARAGLGQLGELHYVLVTANSEHHPDFPDIYEFAEIGKRLGCEKFYNLDGGQTAVICMNDKLINAVVYGYQRQISDIIYFATAIPNGG